MHRNSTFWWKNNRGYTRVDIHIKIGIHSTRIYMRQYNIWALKSDLDEPSEEEYKSGEVNESFPRRKTIDAVVHDVDPTLLRRCHVHCENTVSWNISNQNVRTVPQKSTVSFDSGIHQKKPRTLISSPNFNPSAVWLRCGRNARGFFRGNLQCITKIVEHSIISLGSLWEFQFFASHIARTLISVVLRGTVRVRDRQIQYCDISAVIN